MQSSITHIAFRNLTVEQGMAHLQKMIDDGAGSYDSIGAGIRKKGISVYGTTLRMSHRLIAMAAVNRLSPCACCGKPVDGFVIAQPLSSYMTEDGDNAFHLIPTIQGQFANCDHVIPQTFGGRDVVENMQMTCISCNSSKRHHLSTEDIALVKGVGERIINMDVFFAKARAMVKKYKNAKVNVGKPAKKNSAKVSKGQLEEATRTMESLREVIKYLHAEGISITDYRNELVKKSQRNLVCAEN